MTHWTEDAFARHKDIAAEAQAVLQARERESTFIRSDGTAVFESLLETVIRDVEIFNQIATTYDKKLRAPVRIGDRGFSVERCYTPEFLLRVELSADARFIEYSIQQPSAVDQKPVKRWGRFSLFMPPSGHASLMDGQSAIRVEEASRLLLEPAIQGFALPVQ